MQAGLAEHTRKNGVHKSKAALEQSRDVKFIDLYTHINSTYIHMGRMLTYSMHDYSSTSIVISILNESL